MTIGLIAWLAIAAGKAVSTITSLFRRGSTPINVPPIDDIIQVCEFTIWTVIVVIILIAVIWIVVQVSYLLVSRRVYQERTLNMQLLKLQLADLKAKITSKGTTRFVDDDEYLYQVAQFEARKQSQRLAAPSLAQTNKIANNNYHALDLHIG